jgi:hypothetical protein
MALWGRLALIAFRSDGTFGTVTFLLKWKRLK